MTSTTAAQPPHRPASLLSLHTVGGRAWVALAIVGLLAGCAATLPERKFVPERLVQSAEIEGMSFVRAWGDEALPAFKTFIAAEGPALKAKYEARAKLGQPVVSHMLALSGGADDGAFGAGLLVGWTARGDRPEFDLVTGISAGALIAPFAFLGRDYDRQLGEVFTRYGADSIYEANVLSGLFGGPAFANSDPLRHLIDKYVDRDLVRRIAEERRNGRILLVGTTNLDAQRPVYWDIGRIAQSGRPDSIELIRKVLLASASIPGFFPPVRIRVTAGGKTYEELHVDGGTTREVFLSPADFSFRELDRAIGRRVSRKLWVIRNGKTGAEFAVTEETALAIGQRSLLTVLKNQTVGDLIRMHAKARAEGIDYNLAVLPDDFSVTRPKPFDHGYMQALYDHSRALGSAGYPWKKSPPGILETRR